MVHQRRLLTWSLYSQKYKHNLAIELPTYSQGYKNSVSSIDWLKHPRFLEEIVFLRNRRPVTFCYFKSSKTS